MKILYAIQGTGNGHLSRAHDVIPALRNHGEVDILVSGTQAEVSIPYKINYRLKGMSFIFGKSGGIDLIQTVLHTNLIRLLWEIFHLPVEKYDLIINDFEPVSAWAARWKGTPIISLSHQCSLLFESVPKPQLRDKMGEFLLKYYAPSEIKYGFHFLSFNENIFTPVIRHQVRNQEIMNLGHYTIYLPSYSTEKIIEFLGNFPGVKWDVFSKHSKFSFQHGNINVRPVMGNTFVESMASSEGVLCGAGFETPAEALFMGKKLLVMPMHGQFEQQCNAAALEEMGIKVLRSLNKKYLPIIWEWIKSNETLKVNYPDITNTIVSYIIRQHELTYKFPNLVYEQPDQVLF
jgi:uncharacterized protein (TIGR00661 family)